MVPATVTVTVDGGELGGGASERNKTTMGDGIL